MSDIDQEASVRGSSEGPIAARLTDQRPMTEWNPSKRQKLDLMDQQDKELVDEESIPQLQAIDTEPRKVFPFFRLCAELRIMILEECLIVGSLLASQPET